MAITQTIDKKRTFDTYSTIVEKIEILTPRNKAFYFHLLGGREMNYKAGQFVQVYVPIQTGEIKRRSYSIASHPVDPHRFELIVTLVEGGIASPKLHEIPVGTELNIMGPLGHFTMPDSPPRDLVFIATGSGIAPLRSMIQTLLDKGFDKDINLVFGNRHDNDIIYRQEWEQVASENPHFKYLFTLSRSSENWQGKKGYVQDHIPTFIPDPQNKDFYICGLNKMISDVQAKLLSLNVPKDQIHFERYD